MGAPDIQVVTSFSPAGEKLYGRRFVESFLRHWPERVRLWVGIEGKTEIEASDRVHVFDLNEDQDLQAFLAYTLEHYGEDDATDYNRQPMKFARKVFAMTQPHTWNYEAHEAVWWVWIDADVETTEDVTEEWLAEVLAPRRSVVYLARPEEVHSETGFVAFNLSDREGLTAWLGMRQYYVVGTRPRPRVFDLECWHDSMVLDAVLKRQKIEDTYSLTRTQGLHVWPDSVLGEVMVHHKGPVRKRRAYGSNPR